MLQNQKNIFWEAVIITLFIFGLGILLGIFIESGRADKIDEAYIQSEINLLDIQIQTEALNIKNLDCNQAIEENIKFGDRIFEEAKILQRYEDASRISDVLKEQHRRYDLLRTLFWINSMKIKDKCGDKFHTLVYLYNYDPQSTEEISKQAVFSRFLTEIKDEYGNEIVLIPIAKNLNLTSLNILIEDYKLEEASIILNEKKIFNDFKSLSTIKDYL